MDGQDEGILTLEFSSYTHQMQYISRGHNKNYYVINIPFVFSLLPYSCQTYMNKNIRWFCGSPISKFID